jgi:Grap2 and cyclin-D-interacting
MNSTLEGLRRLSETLVALSSVSRSDVLARCRRGRRGDGSSSNNNNNNSSGDHPDGGSFTQCTHYRVLPSSVRQSYEMLEQGAQLVHATSTKYALMAKIDKAKSHEMAADLLKGCSWVGTACLVLEQHLGGAARRHALNAGRNVVRSVVQLLEEAEQQPQGEEGGPSQPPPPSSALAQRTGVVWESCDVVLNRQLPVGNRTAMRRDLLGYMKECQETIEEFQAMIDAGPPRDDAAPGSDREVGGPDAGADDDDEDDDGHDEWDAFLDGQLDRYRPEELPAVVPCVAMVKCSRGTLNLVLQALDVVGAQLGEATTTAAAPAQTDNGDLDASSSPPQQLSSEDKALLGRMERLHERACQVGIGMTDLGAALYPPLDCDAVGVQVLRQAGAIEQVLRAMTSSVAVGDDDEEEATSSTPSADLGVEWTAAVRELHQKLTSAVSARRTEALEALAEAQVGSDEAG